MEGWWLFWRGCFAAPDGWRSGNGAWCHSWKEVRRSHCLPAGPGWNKTVSAELLMKYRTGSLVSNRDDVH